MCGHHSIVPEAQQLAIAIASIHSAVSVLQTWKISFRPTHHRLWLMAQIRC